MWLLLLIGYCLLYYKKSVVGAVAVIFCTILDSDTDIDNSSWIEGVEAVECK